MLGQIKSSYIFEKIIKFAPKKVYLNIIIHNKILQNELNISIDTYIKFLIKL